MTERILVLKLGALGNVVLSLGPFAAIRQHHPTAEITLLTTQPYAGWLAQSPYFNHIWLDTRPDWWNVPAWLTLRRRLAQARFTRVYDLQTSKRSSAYFRLFPRTARPEWSGIAPGCSHPDRDPNRDYIHDADRQAGQLRQAGITHITPADLSWSTADLTRFNLPSRYALLVPGSSPHRPQKRWPVENYRAVAQHLAAAGITPVVLGTRSESGLASAIGSAAIDLTGRTSLSELPSLARGAQLAIGNDTGPMHLAAVAGCPSLVLFSQDSDPALCAPRGPAVTVLRRPNLADLPISEVLAHLSPFAGEACPGPRPGVGTLQRAG
jgi:ADP-heptose:LPS heptosyltransferase